MPAKKKESCATHKYRTVEQKKEIIAFAEANQHHSKQAICDMIKTSLGYVVKRTILLEYLKNRDSIMGEDSKRQLDRAQYPELEEVLYTWFVCTRGKGLIVNDEILTMKAKSLSAHFKSIKTSFKFSSGWLRRFKDRYGIKNKILHGEGG